MTTTAMPLRETVGVTREESKVIFASSLGTVFEWYDFFLYGSLAVIIGATFFGAFPPETQAIFALLAFAAGSLVRTFGALVFGRVGDLVGRKYTFLVTILIMGLSTFLVGLLPGSATIGLWAPIILIVLRLLQGLALGGEYGGAAIYVAEHAPPGRRGFYTSWIQTTAMLGLFLSLVVILGTRTVVGEQAFQVWGWRVPFVFSFVLLGISVWIRMQLNESPVFQRMKAEGKASKAPLTEAFGRWSNIKIALIALFGLVAGQAVVWYTGQFYVLFFLQSGVPSTGSMPTGRLQSYDCELRAEPPGDPQEAGTDGQPQSRPASWMKDRAPSGQMFLLMPEPEVKAAAAVAEEFQARRAHACRHRC